MTDPGREVFLVAFSVIATAMLCTRWMRSVGTAPDTCNFCGNTACFQCEDR